MKKLLIFLALILAPAIAYAEGLTIITGDDDHMQIMTNDDNGVHWKTIQRTGGGFYVEFDGDTGGMRLIQDLRSRTRDNRDRMDRDRD